MLRLRPEDVREGVVRLNPGGDGATIRSIDPGAYSETIFGGGPDLCPPPEVRLWIDQNNLLYLHIQYTSIYISSYLRHIHNVCIIPRILLWIDQSIRKQYNMYVYLEPWLGRTLTQSTLCTIYIYIYLYISYIHHICTQSMYCTYVIWTLKWYIYVYTYIHINLSKVLENTELQALY